MIAPDTAGAPAVVVATSPWPLLAAGLLTAAPPLLAYNTAPSPTLINQCLAMGLWGGFVLMTASELNTGLRNGDLLEICDDS